MATSRAQNAGHGGSTPPGRTSPPCRHDSLRGDGWLDDHCLRCGADGYWQEGVLRIILPHDLTVTHPSGKKLLAP